MKIEYLHEGAIDCPLIRIFDFTVEELGRLLDSFAEMRTGRVRSVALHDLSLVHGVADCRLTMHLGDKDEGVVPIGDKTFAWRRTTDGWQEVHELAEPFLVKQKGFQWLDEKSPISVLLSQRGLW